MKNVMRFCVTALSTLALVAAVSAAPANRKQTPPASQSAQQTQSVSGKIASVERSSFTLAVNSSTTHQISASQTPAAAPKTMTFQIDKNTTIDGKLKVNATADVVYREEGGNNIAVSVRVTQ